MDYSFRKKPLNFRAYPTQNGRLASISDFYAPVAVENGARGILYSGVSVSVWVSLFVLITLWTSYLKNQ